MKGRMSLALVGVVVLVSLASAAYAKKTVISYVTWWGGDLAETEKMAVKTFMDRNPDIEVRMSTWDWANFHDKLLASTIGGLAPDVFKADVYYMPDYIDAGIAVNLEPYLKRDKMDLSSWYQFTLQPVTNRLDGKLYGFPSNWGGLMYFANRDYFTQNGLPVPNDGWSWEQFVQDLSKMRKDTNGDGKFERFGAGVSYWCWWAWAYTNGGSILSKDARKVTMDTPQIGEAMKFVMDHMKGWRVASPDNAGDWESGRQGMTTMWTHTVQTIKPKFPVSIIEFPYGKSRTYTMKGDCMAIHAGSKKKDAAWKFMKWYLSEEFQAMQMKTGLAPIQRKLAETEWVKWKKGNYDIEIRNALPTQVGRQPKFLECTTPTWRKMETIWNPEFSKVYAGTLGPEEIGRKLQPKLQQVLDEYWKRMDKRRSGK